jgi:signal transduction histidine kinase
MAETLDSTLLQLQTALVEAQEAEASSRRFLADAAHQLRTPLAGIRGCAELLLRGAAEEDRDRLLAVMVRETTRSAHLITALLRIARLDQGEPLPSGEVDVAQLCRDEVERLSLLAPDLEFVLDLSDAPSQTLPLDSGSCREILSNLADNARRHASSRITFTVTTEEQRVLVRVSDDGPGVADEDRDRIFERFVSLDRRGGSGLGLPIARGLAQALGGELCYADGFVLDLPRTTGSD